MSGSADEGSQGHGLSGESEEDSVDQMAVARLNDPALLEVSLHTYSPN